MRELTNHRVPEIDEPLVIEALDDRCEEYAISWQTGNDPHSGDYLEIKFQDGPAELVGVNGISERALLAIIEDRLLAGQDGEFACPENKFALEAVRQALSWVKRREAYCARRALKGKTP